MPRKKSHALQPCLLKAPPGGEAARTILFHHRRLHRNGDVHWIPGHPFALCGKRGTSREVTGRVPRSTHSGGQGLR